MITRTKLKVNVIDYSIKWYTLVDADKFQFSTHSEQFLNPERGVNFQWKVHNFSKFEIISRLVNLSRYYVKWREFPSSNLNFSLFLGKFTGTIVRLVFAPITSLCRRDGICSWANLRAPHVIPTVVFVMNCIENFWPNLVGVRNRAISVHYSVCWGWSCQMISHTHYDHCLVSYNSFSYFPRFISIYCPQVKGRIHNRQITST